MTDPERIAQLEAELAQLRAERQRGDQAAAHFVAAFELVFELDWEFSKLCLAQIDTYVAPGHSFLAPGQFDEESNWCNRRVLLEAYRGLTEELMRRGAYRSVA